MARVRMKTAAVDPASVDNFTRGAQALWAMVFAMTSVNERASGMAADVTPALIAEADKFGKWSVRRQKGIKALVEFYRTWLGDDAAAVITEYWDAKDRAFLTTDRDDPRATRWDDAQLALRALHDGVIVDGYRLERETDEPAWSPAALREGS